MELGCLLILMFFFLLFGIPGCLLSLGFAFVGSIITVLVYLITLPFRLIRWLFR
ncbi:MAG: hypothetical protein AB1497_02665 [Bacillota bacterium]